MTLWKHQQTAVESARKVNDLAIFFEIGTGKTRTMIEILREVCNQQQSLARILILAPLPVCRQWKQEFAKFSKFPQDKILVLTGHGRQRTEKLQQYGKFGGIVVTNYEFVTIEKFYNAVKDWEPEIIVFDESHKLKAPTTTRFKKIAPLADQAKRRFILTGTPILNTPLDLFGQYRMLDGGATFGKNFFAFRNQYAYDRNANMPAYRHFPKWELRSDASEKFSRIISETAVQARKNECLDLPPLVEVEIPVELSERQRRAYDSMQREFIAEVGGGIVSAEFAMTKTLRMQQILGGFASVEGLENPNETEVKFIDDNPRLEALELLLESLENERVIVWTIWGPTYQQLGKLAEKLGRTVGFLTGRETPKQKQDSIDKFRSNEINTLIANPAAGGVGINLAEAKYSIYYTRSYSLEQYLQSQGRNYRGGSEVHDKITHFHILASGTIDEVIYKALAHKEDVASAVLNWAKNSIDS